MYRIKIQDSNGEEMYLEEMEEVDTRNHYCQDHSWGGGISVGIKVLPKFTSNEKDARAIGTHIDLLRILGQMIDAVRFQDIDISYNEITIIKIDQ